MQLKHGRVRTNSSVGELCREHSSRFNIDHWEHIYLVLHAVWKTPSLRSPSILLLCGLALSDLAAGVVVQPLFIKKALVKVFNAQSFVDEHVISNWYNIVVYTVCGVSFGTIAFISFDRLIAILKPFQYPNIITVRRTISVLVSMWLLFTFIASM